MIPPQVRCDECAGNGKQGRTIAVVVEDPSADCCSRRPEARHRRFQEALSCEYVVAETREGVHEFLVLWPESLDRGSNEESQNAAAMTAVIASAYAIVST